MLLYKCTSEPTMVIYTLVCMSIYMHTDRNARLQDQRIDQLLHSLQQKEHPE